MGRGILNSDAIRRKFGNADVYDGSEISLTPNKIPGYRGFTYKIMIWGKGKGAGCERQREAHCAELRANPDEIDNRHTQGEVGKRENDEYQASWGPDK